MEIQPEIKVKSRGRKREKGERETRGKPVQQLAPSSIVQRAFYTFDKTWRSMGNTKLCSVSSPDSYQNQAFLSLLFTLISGWISTWGAEARQVYLLALAVKTRAKGSLKWGILRYSSERRWPNVDGANSLSGILLVFRIIQAIQPSSST